MKHVAYNKTTGEVICTARACALRRRIRHNTQWDRAHGYISKNEWVFAHGLNAYESITERI